jgi:hypothetical protein
MMDPALFRFLKLGATDAATTRQAISDVGSEVSGGGSAAAPVGAERVDRDRRAVATFASSSPRTLSAPFSGSDSGTTNKPAS